MMMMMMGFLLVIKGRQHAAERERATPKILLAENIENYARSIFQFEKKEKKTTKIYWWVIKMS